MLSPECMKKEYEKILVLLLLQVGGVESTAFEKSLEKAGVL